MKGYWYVADIAALASIFVKMFDNLLFGFGLLIWFVVLYKTNRLGKLPIVISLTCFLFFSYYIPSISTPNTIEESQEMTVTGKISSPVSTTDAVLQFRIRDEQSNQLLQATLFNPPVNKKEISTIKYGAICQLNGEVGQPEGARNPGQFDFQHYLASSGVHYELVLDSLADVSCTGASKLSVLYSLREKLMTYVSTHYSDSTSSWLNALVLGDDGGIPIDTEELFQRWGLSHLLAISGLHIGLVVGFVYFIFLRMGVVTREKSMWIMMVFLPIYAVLAGGEPSIWRASLMVLLVICVQKLKLTISITDVISIIFLCLLVVDGYIIYHVGFQLSFLVSFGIILSRKWLSNSTSPFITLLKLSFVAQLVIIPLQILYFYNFNPLSIILNIIVVPYFSFFVIPLMFILLFLSPIPFVSSILDQFFSWIHELLFLRLLDVIDQTSYFPFITGIFPGIVIVFYYVVLLLFMYSLQRERVVRAVQYGVMQVLVIVFLVIRPYFSPVGTVTMLDIGQGDSFVMELPYRKGTILVDAGASFSFEDMEPKETNYTQIIKPYLQYRGISKIDAIFVSHEDIDHVGSVNFITEDFEVDKIIISSYYSLDPETVVYWREKGIEVIRVNQGDELLLGDYRFTIRSPGVDRNGTNENSLVFDVRLGKQNWLFSGDIDKEAELAILNRYPNINIDILKVAHHGSNTSSDPQFLKSIQPSYALISVGKGNSYGHPTKEVIDLLAEEGIIVLRTDQHGAIQYRFTDDGAGTFYRFLP
ncbi:DNA internalization-related competence protein ComEC/Rec2 [Ornithinibacillus contaminans]|uniref:DNA internalization-related competence protein ComEC/Rec2 n=1 Tax=Ornithinibacillus contaminans TaxID=694055 RepID=UPI00064D8F54|nr:DNA internalization-related competence protein ComEC/Rec2 [Ornithinibacillus contaminans]